MKYEELRQHGFPPRECDFILNAIRREIELYKKALEISCEWNELNLGYLNADECLQKARESNNGW